MTLEVRKARVVETDLPSVIAQSANGELVANLSLPSGSGWGPFKFSPCSSRDIWDMRWRRDDGELEHVKMISANEKWFLNLKLTSDSKLANSQLLVDTSKQIVFCDIIREIKRGEVVINIPKIIGSPTKEPSPPSGYVCPYCGISFTKHTTLQAHVTQYCRKRPSQGSHLDGAPLKRSRSTSPPEDNAASILAERAKTEHSAAAAVVAAAAAAAGLAPCPGSHGLSPTLPLSPTLLSSASSGVPGLTPLKYCVQCRLFFANDELFQMHLRLGANLSAVSGQGLVMSAPVITSSGLQYIPVHGASAFTPPPPPHPPLAPQSGRAGLPSEEASVAAAVAATNGAAAAAAAAALGLIDTSSNSPSLPLDLSFRGHGGAACAPVGAMSPPGTPTAALHCIKKAAAAGAVKRQLSEAELAAIPRPFQCQFCQTRFRSVKTLRAHQESYCQGGARAGDVTAVASAARGLKTRNPPVPKSSIASAAVSAATAAILPTLAAQQLRQLGEAELENCWHQTEHGFRCFLCGYVGQTVRGMKLHCKLHRPQPPAQAPPPQPQTAPGTPPETAVHTPTGQDSNEVPPSRPLTSDGERTNDEGDVDLVGSQETSGSFSPQQTQVSPALAIASTLNAIKCQNCDTVCLSVDHLFEHMKTECTQAVKIVKKEAIEQESSE